MANFRIIKKDSVLALLPVTTSINKLIRRTMRSLASLLLLATFLNQLIYKTVRSFRYAINYNQYKYRG